MIVIKICISITIRILLAYVCLVVDIDECAEEECHPSATCVNNPGSFVCNCNPGFIGDGVISCSGTQNFITVKCSTTESHANVLYNLCNDPVFNLTLGYCYFTQSHYTIHHIRVSMINPLSCCDVYCF